MYVVSKIALLSPESDGWREFAVEYATSPLQRPAWLDTLTGAYRLHAQIMALTDSQGSILAVLPMIRGKLPWRNSWTSLPFTDTLEPVAVDKAHRDELLIAVAEDADTQPILIRTHADLPGWFSRQVGTVQVLDISDGVEGVRRGISAHHRRAANRARRPEVGLTARPITSRSEFLGASLALTAQSRRRLGVPTQPRRYWSRVWELHERNEALTIGVYLGDKLVTTEIVVISSKHAVLKYNASDFATRQLRTNYLSHVTVLEHIAALGVQSVDFGITDLQNAGLRQFKSGWGGEEQPAYFSATDARMLPDKLQPGRLLAKTIQHTPVFVGRTVGSIAYPFVA